MRTRLAIIPGLLALCFVAPHVLPAQRLYPVQGPATATGSNGTVLQLEFQKEKLGAIIDNIFGVAVDNKGNIYKMVL